MKLSELLSEIEYNGSFVDQKIKDVVADSRKVSEGSLFVCVKGNSFDGHEVAAEMLKKGAAAVITDHKLGLENEIIVKNTKEANARLCQNFFKNPKDQLKIIGITGTNGKTTIASIIKQALELMGHKTSLIGTIRYEIGDLEIPSKFTTPEPWDIAALFARIVMAGCEYVVMEASSQALDQGRLNGIDFDLAVFTNLTQDHLDYHRNIENYYKAKKILFDNAKSAVINIDDEYGQRLMNELSIPKTTYSIKSNDADYTAKNIECSISDVKFAINGDNFISRASLNMPGLYSANNAMAAFCALSVLGFDKSKSTEAVSNTRTVAGRSEVLYNKGFTVICDFAHTADALEQLLSSIKPFVENRLITLFGCAGVRDSTKRPAMAETVCRYSDVIILSSDNPRAEDPVSIINEILPIIQKAEKPCITEPDRYLAILQGLDILQKGDVLLLCGKGHEDYQVIDGTTIYLDEHRIVNEYFEKK